jgi:hypothetical protein
MNNIFTKPRVLTVALLGSVLLAGCAAPTKTLYQWEGYQPQVYEYFKGQGKEEQIGTGTGFAKNPSQRQHPAARLPRAFGTAVLRHRQGRPNGAAVADRESAVSGSSGIHGFSAEEIQEGGELRC